MLNKNLAGAMCTRFYRSVYSNLSFNYTDSEADFRKLVVFLLREVVTQRDFMQIAKDAKLADIKKL